MSVLTDRDVYTVAAKVIVLTELFIAAGLWSRRTRYAAVWVAVVFHISDRGVGVGQVFSYLGIAVLVIWAVPSTRDRVLRIDPTTERHGDWPPRCARSTGWPASASSRRRPDPRSRSWTATARRSAGPRPPRSRSAVCR